MPSGLRSRIALVALLGAFLIPIGTSSLRGLTHVLTCRDREEIPFTLINEGGDPTIVSSKVYERGAEQGVCGGLILDMGAGPAGGDRVQITLPIRNTSEFDWQGTVRLQLGNATVPVDVGKIPAGATRTERVTVDVDPGRLNVDGSLLIGP